MQALNCPLRPRRWGCVSQQSQRPVGPLLLGVSAPLGVQRQLLIVQAARGFGKTKPKKDDAVDGVSGSRRKTKNVKVEQGSIGPIPGQAQQQVATTFNDQLLVPNQPTEEDDDFAKRLALLKEQGRERAAELKAASPAEGTSAQSASSPAIFDVQEDIYANPPPITQTLMGAAGESSISDPKLRDANIGPSQLGLAAGAIVFVAIFIIVAAGDYAPASKRYSGVRPAQQPPDAIEEKILKGKVALYEDQLKVDPTNTDATEALATAYARLLQYDKAAELLEKLTARLPDDAEAWRLLGESSLLSQQPRKAVPAFERAVQLRVAQQQAAGVAVVTQPDLQLLTGLTDAYIANSDFAKAVDYLNSMRQRIADSTAAAAAAPADTAAAAAPASTEAAADAAAPASELANALPAAPPASLEAPPLTGDAPEDAAAAASTAAAAASLPSPAAPSPASYASPTGSRPVDPVGVELLTAKVYSAWRGHDNDALATYDRLIKAFPEDYRGYLAKGVFLREKGRKADAERMFLQARFFAPGNKQSLVRAIADATPAPIALPDNN